MRRGTSIDRINDETRPAFQNVRVKAGLLFW
jgi:hypothetical protein